MRKSMFIMLIAVLLASCSEDVIKESSAEFPSEEDVVFDKSEFGVTRDDINKVIQTEFGEVRSRSSEMKISTMTDSLNQPLIYCVNFGDNQGFVLISATKKYEPILAYSETGHFNINTYGTPVDYWCKVIKKQISHSRDLPTDSVKNYLTRWRGLLYESTTNQPGNKVIQSRGEGDITDEEYHELDEIVQQARSEFESQGYRVYSITEDVTNNPEWCAHIQQLAVESIYPLYDHVWENLSFIVEIDDFEESEVPNCITTKWIQYLGFNDAFPLESDEYGLHRVYAGCGPVAAGQIMYYYKYPNTFDWNSMDEIESTDAAAELLYDIAVKSKYVKYKQLNEFNQYIYIASVKLDDLAAALRSYGYSAKFNAHNKVTRKRIVSQDQSLYPYIISGITKDADSGHAWIISGGRSTSETHYYKYYTLTDRKRIGDFECTNIETYDYDYLYCVWGWLSSYDGWYMSLYEPVSHTPFEKIETITNIHPIR